MTARPCPTFVSQPYLGIIIPPLGNSSILLHKLTEERVESRYSKLSQHVEGLNLQLKNK